MVWGMSECDRKGSKIPQPLVQGAVPWIAVRSPVLQVWFSHWVREQESVSQPLCASAVVTTLPCFTGLARELRALDPLAKGCSTNIIIRIVDWMWFSLGMG